MPITNLTGTSWLINTTIPTTSVDFNSLNFTTDYGTRSYTRFRITSSQLRYYYSSSYDTAYRYSAWTQQGYRTIHITGGTKATDQTAINWFSTNAVQITPTVEYTVTYSTEHGTTPQPKTVEENHQLTARDLPTLSQEGYTFGGWYRDSSYQTPALGTTVTSNITVYAKWTEVSTSHLYVGNDRIAKAYLGGNVVKIYIGNTRII